MVQNQIKFPFQNYDLEEKRKLRKSKSIDFFTSIRSSTRSNVRIGDHATVSNFVRFSPDQSEIQQQGAESLDRYLSSNNYISETKMILTIDSGTKS